MDYAAYLDARETLGLAGRSLTALLLFLAAALAASALLPPLFLAVRAVRAVRAAALAVRAAALAGRPATLAVRAATLAGRLVSRLLPRLVPVTLLLQGIGFLALVWFHWRVRQTVPLVEPGTGQILARYALPLWIEGEKLYFWALLIGTVALVVSRRQPAFSPYVNTAWAAWLAIALLLTNPFSDPLPRFHEEVNFYRAVLLFAGESEQWQWTEMLYGRLTGFYNSTYMWVHPPMIFVSYAILLVAFLANLPLVLGRGGTLFAGLAYGYARLGYLILTLGILIGYPWTREAWRDQPWWWDPKINMTLMMWVLYTAYLHSHLYVHRGRGMARLTAILGLTAFLALLFTYVTTYVIPGIHAVA